MRNEKTNDEIIAAIRLRSQRYVQIVFASFTIIFSLTALCAHHVPDSLALTAAEAGDISGTFLLLASAYAVCLFAWEHLYPVHD